jgi:hypothetical protein
MTTMDLVFRIPEGSFVRATRHLEHREFDALEELRKPAGVHFDGSLVDRLVEHVKTQEWSISDADSWLAPRLHCVLRFPRRVAADRGVWFWLAATRLQPYVEWRFRESRAEKNKWWRYQGDLLRNGVSRLWWGAEMLRDGSSYALVPHAYRSVRTFMFVSELRYSMYREAARAFTRVAAGRDAKGEPDGEPRDDAEIQRLSVLFNTYLRLDVLESHGAEHAPLSSTDWDAAWADSTPTWLELCGDVKSLSGPSSGRSEPNKEQAVMEWLRKLASQTGALAEVGVAPSP